MDIRLGADVRFVERRASPQSQVFVPARITLLEVPEREINGFLIDASASVIRLVMDEHLHPEQVIGVEVENHLVLADVRHSTPRGSKFTIGAERIHTLQELSLPERATRMERIDALVNDFQLRLRNGLSGVDAQLCAPHTLAPSLTTEAVVPGAVVLAPSESVPEAAPLPDATTDPVTVVPITSIVMRSEISPEPTLERCGE